MKQYILGSVLCCTALTSGYALAACTQTPDCETMGYIYTAEECPNGGVKCPFDTSKYFCFNPQTCNYTYTAESCAANCQNVGSSSCVRNGVTYYQSCGSSKCSSGQTCSNGTCKNNLSGQYFECCDNTGRYCSNYSVCKSYWGFDDCSDVIASYEAQGCLLDFHSCYEDADDRDYMYFRCQ